MPARHPILALLAASLAAVLLPRAPAQDLEPLLAILRAAESVDDDAVGYHGIKTETYKTYEKLRDRATAAELRDLCRDDSPVVRCYALQALVDAHPAVALLPILCEHLRDTEAVVIFRGCIKAERPVGDVLIELAKPRLADEQYQELARALVLEKSPLPERDAALRNVRFPDALLHELRALAQGGNDAALIALVRYGLKTDLELVGKSLRSGRPLRELGDALRAAEAAADPALLPALTSLAKAALRALQTDTGYRLRFWFRAIAAQRSEPAAELLAEFAFADAVPASRRDAMLRALVEALAAHDAEPFAPLRERVAAAMKK